MKTLLDDETDWLFEGASYDEELRLYLVEGFESEVPEEDAQGGVPVDVHPLTTTDESRRYELRFPRPIAWQCTEADLVQPDLGARADDDGAVQILEGSAYLAYHDADGLETELGPLRHFRVRTEDEVVDVICDAAPELRLVPIEELAERP